jgi:hypothetical protein
MSARAAARLAWSLWGLVIVLAVASFIVRHWMAPQSPHEGTWHLQDILWWSILIPALVPAYATVGALVVARRPGNPVGWLCLALGGLVTLEDVAGQIRNCGREPLAGGAQLGRSRREARREGSGAGVRPVGPGGRST